MSILLAVLLMMGLLTTAASAVTEGVNGEAQITRRNHTGTAYDTYRSRSVADLHQVTIYANKADFPIQVKMRPFRCGWLTQEITTYGIHRESWENFFGDRRTYITIVVKAYPAPAAKPSAPKTPTKEEILGQKTETLVEALGLPCWHYSDDSCLYTREVKAFISGEWDGSMRDSNDESGYHATRYVTNRTYRWIGSDLYTGKAHVLSANVDYNGYKEVIPGSTRGQDYSLAVSYVNGEIEKWSLFEKQDAWRLAKVASGNETIDMVIPLANKDSNKDDCQVVVSTTDVNGQQHIYDLMPNGIVEPLF